MRKRINAIKPLNKALSTYPNLYFGLHEGIADGDIATIADQNSANTWALTVETPGATQWGATLGNWEPASGNSAQYMSIDMSAYQTEYEAVFGNLNTSAWMIICSLDYVRDDAASQWFFAIQDKTNQKKLFNLRSNPAVAKLIPVLFCSTEDAATQTNEVSSAEGEQVWVAYVDMRAGVKTSTVYRFDPGTKVHNITSSQTKDISTLSFGTIDYTTDTLTVGARDLTSSVDKYLDVGGIRDLRFINFGTNPPSDIVNLIEEFAINSNVGTRRTY